MNVKFWAALAALFVLTIWFFRSFKKGSYFYETQLLMFVFMWQHNMKFSGKITDGLRVGRLYIWRDSQWLKHGVPGDVRYFCKRLTHSVVKPTSVWEWYRVLRINSRHMLWTWLKPTKVVRFCLSLDAYLRLYRAGFYISRSTNDTFASEINRFYWKGKIIKDMSDIDCVDGHYNTMFNGHSERLS